MANQLGKRYRCSVCGSEAMCTKAGTGVIECCGKPMELQEPRKVASAD